MDSEKDTDEFGGPVHEAVDTYHTGSGAVYKQAAQEGLVVRAPKDNELFIDIDDENGMSEYDRNYALIAAHVGIKSAVVTPSRTKPEGKHIVVTLETTVSPLERCLLQAVLGSDRRREAHGFLRIRDNDPEPTLFLEKPCTKIDPISPTQSPQT